MTRKTDSYKTTLRELVVAWELDHDLEFLFWLAVARRLTGVADPKEDAEDLEALIANGYDPDAKVKELKEADE